MRKPESYSRTFEGHCSSRFAFTVPGDTEHSTRAESKILKLALDFRKCLDAQSFTPQQRTPKAPKNLLAGLRVRRFRMGVCDMANRVLGKLTESFYGW